MLVSPAWAHGMVRDDAAGGGTALLIILTVVIVAFLGYSGQKKWRKRRLERNDGHE
jgi:hypothetical protein